MGSNPTPSAISICQQIEVLVNKVTQKLMAELFQKDVRTINEHIQNIFAEGELSPESVIRKFRITAADGKTYETQHYNLDVIISVGLERVDSAKSG